MSIVDAVASVDAPTNAVGETICGEECEDGSPCQRSVPIPGIKCPVHRGNTGCQR